MISNKSRIIELEAKVLELQDLLTVEEGLDNWSTMKFRWRKKEVLSVPIVNSNGEYVRGYPFGRKEKEINFEQVCVALQEMCGIEITYQEIPGKEGVVIYEKEDD